MACRHCAAVKAEIAANKTTVVICAETGADYEEVYTALYPPLYQTSTLRACEHEPTPQYIDSKCLSVRRLELLAQAAYDNDFDPVTWEDQWHCLSCQKCQSEVNIVYQMIAFQNEVVEDPLKDDPTDYLDDFDYDPWDDMDWADDEDEYCY